MQKCSLCDKKIPKDAKFCPECGWDLTEHELTPPQMARIQEEIQYARFRAIQYALGEIPVVTIALVSIILSMCANLEIIPEKWDFMWYVALPFMAIFFVFVFLRDRHWKKQDKLRRMLRDRRPSQ
jgi:amino acid permease